MNSFHLIAFLISLIFPYVYGEEKQLYHIIGPKPQVDNIIQNVGETLDIWKTQVVNESVQVDIYATIEEMNQFHTKSRFLSQEASMRIERSPIHTSKRFKSDAARNIACSRSTKRHLKEISSNSKYTDNKFFNCWRNADEVYDFLKALADENPAFFSEIPPIGKSYQGRHIRAYKLSTGTGKKAIYVQGLLHPREWHAGSTVFYAIASFLDAVRNNDASVKPVVDQYDWYFVPIANIDGYIFTHLNGGGDRAWRKNRRMIRTKRGVYYGVDLNRNWGPSKYFKKEQPTSLSYPGEKPLSEPETQAIHDFLKKIPLVGALDIHAYGGYVVRPFGSRKKEAPSPWKEKFQKLGNSVKHAIELGSSAKYKSIPSHEIYISHGTFIDCMFLEFEIPSLGIEMEGTDFFPRPTVIRPGGQHIFNGMIQFARELADYYS